MPKKGPTIEQMRAFVADKGDCLSTVYTNNLAFYEWLCKTCGHIWTARWLNVQLGHWCPNCFGTKKRTIEEMHKEAEANGLKCLSKEYKNCKTKLEYKCPNSGHPSWWALPNNIRRGTGCPKCARIERYGRTIEQCHQLAESKGYELLSENFLGASKPLKFRCKKDGFEWEIRISDMERGHGCPLCSRHAPINKRPAWYQEIYEIEVKLIRILRKRAREALKRNRKPTSMIENLGCTKKELMEYLESKFYPNPRTGELMTFENHGSYGWHIDHIKPLSSFDLTDPEQFKQAVHYTNLQPLWWFENLSKGNKTDYKS